MNHRAQQLIEALHDNPATAGPMAVRVGLLLGGDLADLLGLGLIPRIAEMDEQALADLHAAVIGERERRLAEPERLSFSGITTGKTLARCKGTDHPDPRDSHPPPPNAPSAPLPASSPDPTPTSAGSEERSAGDPAGKGEGGSHL